MALRDIFKFRELPESETSKPFLEHLEDLRWTIVKMGVTLALTMIVCFAFRTTLVRILQAPLKIVDPGVGSLRALGITDSITISFHLAFYAGIVVSFPLLLYFLAEFVLPALSVVEKKIYVPGDRRQLWVILVRRAGVLFLAAPKDDPVLLSRYPITRLDTDLDRAGVLLVRDTIHHRVWARF